MEAIKRCEKACLYPSRQKMKKEEEEEEEEEEWMNERENERKRERNKMCECKAPEAITPEWLQLRLVEWSCPVGELYPIGIYIAALSSC